ncbi:MAG: hypothetical protein EOO41_03190, partial [Methanobacteriota archaeon]
MSFAANPLARASILAQILFTYPSAFLRLRGRVTPADFFTPLPQDDAANLHNKLREGWQRTLKAGRPSLFRAFVYAFGWQYVVYLLPLATKSACVLAQTQFLALLLTTLRVEDGNVVPPYLYALGLVLTGAGGALMHHTYFFQSWRGGMRMRLATICLLFEKSLSMRMDALSAVSAGHIITLAATDIERFQKASQYVCYIVLAPLEAVA